MAKKQHFFTREDLISFGTYMKTDARKENITRRIRETNYSITNRQQVYTFDIEDWLEWRK